ncbi:MAG: electron transport complex subunit RsxC [Candidatus Margulisbacteria bacterium]|nr:electron transport complex subunit RsxC [Candidatus Margulisiibacteriota bacterium]
MKTFPRGLHVDDNKLDTKDKPIKDVAGVVSIPDTGCQIPVKAANLDSLCQFSAKDILHLVESAGIVGMGGAGFPTFKKLVLPEGIAVNTVIINGCECEPYITADYRLMLEKPERIVFGAKLLAKASGASKIIFGIEDNKREAVKAVKAAIREHPAEGPIDIIDVVVLPTKYPQGGEKQLIQSITGKEVPSGGLPRDVGAVVFNAATASAAADAALDGVPLTKRVITVTGSGVKEPQNLLVKIGTTVAEAVNYCGGMTADAAKVILGGPMMGVAVSDLNTPVEKTTSCILVLNEREAKLFEESNCIRCGRCIKACPTGLMPNFLAEGAKAKNWKKADKEHVLDCIECGCCAYVCPSRIPLVQYFKKAKLIVTALRKKQADNAKRN